MYFDKNALGVTKLLILTHPPTVTLSVKSYELVLCGIVTVLELPLNWKYPPFSSS